MALDRDY